MGDFENARVYIKNCKDTNMNGTSQELLIESLVFEAALSFFLNRMQVLQFVTRLTTMIISNDGSLNSPNSAKAGVMCGITLLQHEKYREAASTLLKISPDVVSSISEFALPEDLALYITLCALASFSRSELQFLASADQSFTSFSEGSNQNFKELIESLLSSGYTKLFSELSKFKADYESDPFLFPILNNLLAAIKKRAFLQYLSVYRNVSIDTMAETFLISAKQVEMLLQIYTIEGAVNVLIDQRTKVSFISIHYN